MEDLLFISLFKYISKASFRKLMPCSSIHANVHASEMKYTNNACNVGILAVITAPDNEKRRNLTPNLTFEFLLKEKVGQP